MKSIQFIRLVVAIAVVTLFSCQGKNTGNSPDNENKNAVVKTNSKGKYAIKSGIIEYNGTVMGMQQTQTQIFDDYGNKEVTLTQMEMMGVKTDQHTLTKDGFTYTFDMKEKTGTKTPASPVTNIDFRNLTEDMKNAMKLEELGKETFLGKSCVKYSLDYDRYQMKGSFLVWNGIPLKTNIDMSGIEVNLEATKIEENPTIPAGTFDVPDDIKFQ